MPAATSAVTPPEMPTKRRRAILAGIAVMALMALVISGALVVHKWRHPEAFHTYANNWTVGYEQATVGRTEYVGMSYGQKGQRGTVHIRGAVAHGISDTADSSVGFVVCTLKSDLGGIGAGDQAMVDRFCSSVVPAAGATIEVTSPPTQQLLLAVTLGKPGRVEIHGADLSYSYGWQSGTQHIGGNAVIGKDPSTH